MKIAVISFSRRGFLLGKTLCQGLERSSHEVELAVKSKYIEESLTESLREWTGKRFMDSDAVVFIGACGIAVRSIAPFVKSKKADPAVVVVDEQGKFSISLLSGHMGGANELSEEIAGLLDAQPVVTTATDLSGIFAVDVFAEKNGCSISDMRLAKEVSAALLAGREVGFASDFPVRGELPKGLRAWEEGEENPKLGICVTERRGKQPFLQTLYLIPKVITLGIGCRRDTPRENIEAVTGELLLEAGIFTEAVEQAASIDLKKDEAGIRAFCEKRGWPFVTYTADELNGAEGSFSESDFVREVTGVGSVCERAAVLGSSGTEPGRLIRKKYARDGVTAALAVKKWSVEFE